MKSNPFSLLLLLIASLGFSAAATAQWQWVDEGGRSVYSDRPPPASVPESKIVKQPRGNDYAPAPVTSKPVEQTAGATPAPAGVDPELQKKLEAEAKAKEEEAAAIEAKNTQIKAANCANARRAIAQLEPGRRVTTVNDRGETVFMNDETRAAERRKAQTVINENCQ